MGTMPRRHESLTAFPAALRTTPLYTAMRAARARPDFARAARADFTTLLDRAYQYGARDTLIAYRGAIVNGRLDGHVYYDPRTGEGCAIGLLSEITRVPLCELYNGDDVGMDSAYPAIQAFVYDACPHGDDPESVRVRMTLLDWFDAWVDEILDQRANGERTGRLYALPALDHAPKRAPRARGLRAWTRRTLSLISFRRGDESGGGGDGGEGGGGDESGGDGRASGPVGRVGSGAGHRAGEGATPAHARWDDGQGAPRGRFSQLDVT